MVGLAESHLHLGGIEMFSSCLSTLSTFQDKQRLLQSYSWFGCMCMCGFFFLRLTLCFHARIENLEVLFWPYSSSLISTSVSFYFLFICSFCLCYVMQHANSPEGYVRAKVASVAAQLLKRGW